jgi:dTDP-glucose pyrophosphorylase
MVISSEKGDIVRYFAERDYAAQIFYAVQPTPKGLCDALFRAEPFARQHDRVLIGLPDTIWFPENGYRAALAATDGADVSLLLFPVADPSQFDAVVYDHFGFVTQVLVKQPHAESPWVWGAVTTTGPAFRELKLLWEARHRRDEYLGHLLNAYIAAGNAVRAAAAGEIYMDVGTLQGYRAAQDQLRQREQSRIAA